MFGRLLWIIFFVVVGGMLWFRIKRFIQKHKSSSQPSIITFQTVRCAHCGVHLPEQEAVHEDGNSFCCVAHQKAFKAR